MDRPPFSPPLARSRRDPAGGPFHHLTSRPPLRVWVWTAATLALVVVATLLWRGSDAAATSRTTASPAAAPSGSPSGELSEAWSRGATVLPGQVVAAGRVLVGERHGVSALDPATGEAAWHYTRSKAVLCGLTATDGVVVAVFRTADRCDEAVALRADTGNYTWTRSVDLDPGVTLTSTRGSVLAVSRGSVVDIDPIGDNIRWRSAPDGCAVLDGTVGAGGVAVLVQCDDGLQVRLLDANSGSMLWTVALPGADTGALAGADRGVGVVVGDELRLLAGADGAVRTTVPLPAAGADDPHPLATSAGGVPLVWARGTLFALAGDGGSVLWSRPALGLPTTVGTLKVVVGTEPLLVPEDGGFAARDPRTGDEVGRSAVAGLPAGGVSTPVGDVVVYRLPDRVTAYS